MPPALVPLVQLAVSAARADGELSDEEIAVIRMRAGELGAAALVDSELQQRRSLDTITPAFTTPEQRQMAYAIAYAVVHGEEAVSAGERMYLTQLQRLLSLDHADVERIERETLAGDGEPLTTKRPGPATFAQRASAPKERRPSLSARSTSDRRLPSPGTGPYPVPGTRFPTPDPIPDPRFPIEGDTHVVLRAEQRPCRPDHVR